MRDKKVRAWDKVTETYLYSGTFPSMWQFYKELENRGIRHWETEDYTGLKDKNGKEIYEGDIIEPVPNAEVRYIVKWNEYRAGFILLSPRNRLLSTASAKDYILELFIEPFERVIIGNIYEDKELLEK